MNTKIITIFVIMYTASSVSLAQSAWDYYKSGFSKFQSENYSGAIQDCKKALELNSKDVNSLPKGDLQYIYSLIGCSYVNMENYTEAIPYLNKSIELKPNAEDYFSRGISYSELQENNSAIDDYTNAIKLKPDFAYAYTNRGIIYLNIGYQEDACKDFMKALELGDAEVKSYIRKYCQ